MFTRLVLQCRTVPCNNHPFLKTSLRSFTTSPTRWETHYETLGVHKNAAKNKIKLTYFELSKKYHPDLSSDPDAKEKFTKITQAYAVLGNEQSRKDYDKQLLEERAAEIRRRLQEARERDLERKKQREKSEAGKAHPLTKYAYTMGQWLYEQHQKRRKGDYSWEHPVLYRWSRLKPKSTSGQSSSSASSSSRQDSQQRTSPRSSAGSTSEVPPDPTSNSSGTSEVVADAALFTFEIITLLWAFYSVCQWLRVKLREKLESLEKERERTHREQDEEQDKEKMERRDIPPSFDFES